MSEYPDVLYPTIVSGKIYTDKLRYESLDGDEMIEDVSGSVEFSNFKPFSKNGKMWAVTHLQKYSKRGWIKTSPDCFHWWFFWKLQEKDTNGNWIPNSEQGVYFRKPFSWRWDVVGTMIDGVLRHWIKTKGYLGGHWD